MKSRNNGKKKVCQLCKGRGKKSIFPGKPYNCPQCGGSGYQYREICDGTLNTIKVLSVNVFEKQCNTCGRIKIFENGKKGGNGEFNTCNRVFMKSERGLSFDEIKKS